jgi:ABC-type glycerol-3-phosphate transport system substrate-binding protein
VLLDGSEAADDAAMHQLFHQGRAVMTCNGTSMLSHIQAATPTDSFDLHVARLPLIDGASRARSMLAWIGFTLPARSSVSADSAIAFLEDASRPEVDRAVVEGIQCFSPLAGSNAVHDPVAREFLPMLEGAIQPRNWLWEPEIDAEMGRQVQALVKGETDAASVGMAIEAVAQALRAAGRSDYP